MTATRKIPCCCIIALCPVLALAGATKKVKPATTKPAPAKQQPGESIITIKHHTMSIEPVKITGLYVGAQKVEPNKKFATHENWLRVLSVEVKNTSDVNVKFIQIALYFNKPGGGEWMPGVSLRYGWNYFRYREIPKDTLDVVFTPGATVLAGFGEEQYNSVMEVFKEAPPEAFKNISLVVEIVVYEDVDKAWVDGFHMKRAPDGWVADGKKIGRIRRPQCQRHSLPA
jgi:hypothetical protein